MRELVFALVAMMLAAPGAAAEEALVFHTAQFQDATVSLRLVSSRTTGQPGYDYDVIISLSQTNALSGRIYNDPGKHRALVKCGEPARVSVRGVDYMVPISGAGGDWKADLWRAVCETPVS